MVRRSKWHADVLVGIPYLGESHTTHHQPCRRLPRLLTRADAGTASAGPAPPVRGCPGRKPPAAAQRLNYARNRRG